MRRVLLLLGCLLLGGFVGTVGWYATGSEHWFLAIPAVVAVAWLAVANPSTCEPPPERRTRSGHGAA
jgi:hypothetical protein